MKKIALIVLTILICINLFSQTEKKAIGINKQFLKTDTTRTFTVQKQDKDKCIEKLIAAWGKPETNNTGTISWTNIKLVGFDNEINIRLCDGIFCTKNTIGKYTYFKDENDKKEKIGKMKENEHRYMIIEILDKNGLNIVNSINLENKIMNLLTDLLKNID